MIVDFHAHTYESDGTLSPQAVADLMSERGVEIFSITDHDSLSAYAHVVPSDGSRIVTGIEINTTYRENEVHILGFALPLDSPRLRAMIERNVRDRRLRVEKMVDRLRRAGYGISMSDVLEEATHAKALGRPHVGKALIRAGLVSDIDAAFRNLLRRGKPGYVASEHITPHEAIEEIHAAGGVAVMAHPGRLKDRAMVDEFAQRGLDGIEVYHPSHDAGDVGEFHEKAKHYGLLVTAGSDFHDPTYNPQGVGIDVDADVIRPFLDRVA